MRREPIMPYAIHSSIPPDGAASAVPFRLGSMAGLIGTRSVVHASAVSPAMIETVVYARSQGRRLAIDAASPPPESFGAARASDSGFARIFLRPGNPLLIAIAWTSIR